MRDFFHSVLGLFKAQPSGPNTTPQSPGDGSKKKPNGAQAEVAFRVPGMS